MSGPKSEDSLTAALSQQIGNILRRVSKSLQPQNLSQMNRTEIRECFFALEQMKMLISELEILQISEVRSQKPMSSETPPNVATPKPPRETPWRTRTHATR